MCPYGEATGVPVETGSRPCATPFCGSVIVCVRFCVCASPANATDLPSLIAMIAERKKVLSPSSLAPTKSADCTTPSSAPPPPKRSSGAAAAASGAAESASGGPGGSVVIPRRSVCGATWCGRRVIAHAVSTGRARRHPRPLTLESHGRIVAIIFESLLPRKRAWLPT